MSNESAAKLTEEKIRTIIKNYSLPAASASAIFSLHEAEVKGLREENERLRKEVQAGKDLIWKIVDESEDGEYYDRTHDA